MRSEAIHGNKSQNARQKALDNFSRGRARVLVATDLASRGIDVSGVTHVINYELPADAESYVHRIGRTARAGASGSAIAFCAEDERPYLRDIEKVTRQKIPVRVLPDDFMKRADALKAVRIKTIGNDPAPREDRPRQQRGPARPRATHAPTATRDYANASRRGPRGGGGGRGRGGPRTAQA